jgi:hypothetical protein
MELRSTDAGAGRQCNAVAWPNGAGCLPANRCVPPRSLYCGCPHSFRHRARLRFSVARCDIGIFDSKRAKIAHRRVSRDYDDVRVEIRAMKTSTRAHSHWRAFPKCAARRFLVTPDRLKTPMVQGACCSPPRAQCQHWAHHVQHRNAFQTHMHDPYYVARVMCGELIGGSRVRLRNFLCIAATLGKLRPLPSETSDVRIS